LPAEARLNLQEAHVSIPSHDKDLKPSRFAAALGVLGMISLAACAEPDQHGNGVGSRADQLGELASVAGKQFTRYIALGDSFVSGDGIVGAAGACKLSDKAWPHVLNARLKETQGGAAPQLKVAACSGATTAKLRATQLQALKGADANTLVTVTIGGNDTHVADEVATCLLSRSSCATEQKQKELKTLIEGKVKTELESLFATIRRDAGKATVLATGYPFLVTKDAHATWGCALLDDDEVAMIRSSIQLMNQVIAKAASDNGLIPVTGLEEAFGTHEACAASSSNRWINGGDLGDIWGAARAATLLHPNVNGNKVFAGVVFTALQTRGLVTPAPIGTVSHVLDTGSDPAAMPAPDSVMGPNGEPLPAAPTSAPTQPGSAGAPLGDGLGVPGATDAAGDALWTGEPALADGPTSEVEDLYGAGGGLGEGYGEAVPYDGTELGETYEEGYGAEDTSGDGYGGGEASSADGTGAWPQDEYAGEDEYGAGEESGDGYGEVVEY
jgi:lysophospholipase L1-like esterase